jgi:hypothetical protein
MEPSSTGRTPGRMIVHDATYRVVVVRNPEPVHELDGFNAFCVERNLAGRGADIAAAIHDLAATMAEVIGDEYAESLPEHRPNPDPELVEAFERRANQVDEGPVIRRGMLRVRLVHTADSAIEAEDFTFSPVEPELLTP